MTWEEFSQHVNGVSIAITGVFMVWAILFLWQEALRREMTISDMFYKLPSAMAFTLAVLVVDAGVWTRAMVIWVWRRFYDSEPFGIYQTGLLELGAVLIAIGGLAKIRVVTMPHWGNLPWLGCVALAAALFFLL
jgi:hypothetical protein